MIRNYLVVAFRNLLRNVTFATVNIIGLSTGIACTILILLWVVDELSFDSFIPKNDRLYRLYVNTTFDGQVMSWNSVPLPTYEALKTQHASIKSTAVLSTKKEFQLTVEQNGGYNSINKRGQYASEEFFPMFEYPFVKRISDEIFLRPDEVVITESTAKALFGDADPIERVVTVNNQHLLRVVGVLNDLPQNSTLQFDVLLPWKLYETFDEVKQSRDSWNNDAFQVFVELDDAGARHDVESNIRGLLESKGASGYDRNLFLHPLSQWRLYSRFQNGQPVGGMIEYVRLFSAIAVLILAIACINFMSLSTARSEKRAREVGVRKSVGSSRRELIFQFLGESMLMSSIAYGVAITLVMLVLPMYNDLVDKVLRIDFSDPWFLAISIALIFFTGFLSGSYPAFYLSSFHPISVLKGRLFTARGSGTFRQVLVVGQFGFSIVLIMATIVMYSQIKLLKDRDLGYDQENLIALKNTQEIAGHYNVIKQELLGVNEVMSVTQSNSSITSLRSKSEIFWPGKPEDLNIIFSTVYAGYDYAKTMGIQLLEGRDFSEDFPGDTSSMLVNSAAIDIMGLADPIGTRLEFGEQEYTLIGILDDVVMEDPAEPVEPLFMLFQPEEAEVISVRLNPHIDVAATLEELHTIFKKYSPTYPFDFEFADEEYARKFASINLVSNLAAVFAFLAVLITGLGLFGLATFTAERRTKEMSIRKVLGASVHGLVGLISRDFTRFVLIANVIFLPVSWWVLDTFLQQYPYRTGIPGWGFAITAGLTLSFTILIVSTRVFGVARSNLVNLLRTE